MNDATETEVSSFFFAVLGNGLRLYALLGQPESMDKGNYEDKVAEGWIPLHWKLLDDAEKTRAAIQTNVVVFAVVMMRRAQQH
jgi:hypothetical protein